MAAYERRQLRGTIVLLAKPLLAVLLITGTLISLQLLLGHLPITFQSVSNVLDSSATKLQQQQQAHSDHNHGTITKALVIASTTKYDTSWLSQIPPSLNWTIHHYRVDAPISPSLTVPYLKGNEAMVYLTYIIDNYENLPDVILFHHAHLTAWHQRLSSLVEVTRLRPEYILKTGYASTRCLAGRENLVKLEGSIPGDWAMFPRLDRKTHLVTLLDAFLSQTKARRKSPRELQLRAVRSSRSAGSG